MSNSFHERASGIKPTVVLYVLAAILFAIVGLLILEASNKSVILGEVIDANGLLPVSIAVYLGSFLLGVALFLIDRSHSFSHWYRSGYEDLKRPALKSYWWIFTLVSFALVTSMIWHSFGPPIDRIVSDYFHEGEILAGFTVLQKNGDIPILIHGPGRNLLPGALALRFSEPGQEIAFMRFVTGAGAMGTLLMVALATYVFSFTLLEGLSSGSRRHSLSAIACLFATLIAFTQAAITNRHLFFLLALALAAAILHAADRKNRGAIPLAVVFGAVCALAPIYVYATGLQTLAIAVIVAAILLFRHGLSARRLFEAGAVSFAACVIVVILLGGSELYLNAFRDISWWALEGVGIWSLPISGWRAIGQTVVLIGVMAYLGYLAFYLSGSDNPFDRKRASVMALLAFSVAIAARDMLERSDAAHTEFTMLTVAIAIGALSAPLFHRTRSFGLKQMMRAVVLLTSIGVVLILSAGGPRQIYWKLVSALGNGAPEFSKLETIDADILPGEIVTFAEWFRESVATGDCLLVLTNEGVLNYAVSLPPCGEFFYPVYASVQSGDRRLAEWLSANPQLVAVIETDFWSGRIDGKPMKDRLPQVWEIIEKEMSARKKIEGRAFAIRQ